MNMKKKEEFIDTDELQNDESVQSDADNAILDENEIENTSENNNDDKVAEETDPLKELQDQYDELNNKYLRLHAEFDNFRKRTVKEKAEIIKTGGERIVMNILPFADDFERALQSLHSADDKDAVVEGMDLIYSKFIEFLKQQGIKEIEAIGEAFDADKFEAVTTIPVQDESQKGVVIDCIQKGYYMHDKIIRYPKVIVGE